MSDYSKVNLSNIDSSSENEDIKARFGRKFLDSNELGVSLFQYAPGFKATMSHSHREQEEVYVVIKGSGYILLNDKVEPLKLLDTIRVAAPVVRAFKAGPEGLDIIAIGGHKPVDGDGVRHDAIWPN